MGEGPGLSVMFRYLIDREDSRHFRCFSVEKVRGPLTHGARTKVLKLWGLPYFYVSYGCCIVENVYILARLD